MFGNIYRTRFRMSTRKTSFQVVKVKIPVFIVKKERQNWILRSDAGMFGI